MIGAALQKAIWDALTADPPIVDGRVYDQVPKKATFPYVTIGDETARDAGSSCWDGWEVFSDIHIWSQPRNGSKAEAKAIAAAVVDRLVTGAPEVPGYIVPVAQMFAQRSLRDPDGETEHVVVTVRHELHQL